MSNPISFYYVDRMQNLFVNQADQTIPGSPTFSAMNSMADFWNVLQGPILNGLYNGESWYNGDNASQIGFIYYENKILGEPRLRQLRVKNNSCSINKLFKNMISDCYDSYGMMSEDTAPFGIYNSSSTNLTDTA